VPKKGYKQTDEHRAKGAMSRIGSRNSRWRGGVTQSDALACHRQAKREWLTEQKDRPCGRCGGRFPAYVMDFHHRDSATKLFTVGRTATRGYDGLVAEIAKCDLFCANCHRIVEWEEKRKWEVA
jgi:hypothetical protein